MRSQRLQRFFRDFDLDYAVVARLIVALMNIPQPWTLSTDRTIAYGIRQRSCRIGAADWSFGQTRFNILMLGVIHDGIAYPLIWTMLDRKGNSNSNERMDLLDRFEKIFPDAKVAYISGDREFVGKEWLTYLLVEPAISFRLRIRLSRASPTRSVVGTLQRASDRISDGKKQLRARTRMRCIAFANLKPDQTQTLSGRRWVWGRLVYVSALLLSYTIYFKGLTLDVYVKFK